MIRDDIVFVWCTLHTIYYIDFGGVSAMKNVCTYWQLQHISAHWLELSNSHKYCVLVNEGTNVQPNSTTATNHQGEYTENIWRCTYSCHQH